MVAPLAIPAVFGPKWVEAGALAQVFAFMALPFTLNQFVSPSMGALGASRSLLFISLSQLGLTALFTFLAAPYGLFAVAWAYLARAYLTLPLQVILLKRASGIGFGRTWAAIWEQLAASAVMGIALHYGLPAAERLTANPWLRLSAGVAAGTASSGCALIAISPPGRAIGKTQ